MRVCVYIIYTCVDVHVDQYIGNWTMFTETLLSSALRISSSLFLSYSLLLSPPALSSLLFTCLRPRY